MTGSRRGEYVCCRNCEYVSFALSPNCAQESRLRDGNYRFHSLCPVFNVHLNEPQIILTFFGIGLTRQTKDFLHTNGCLSHTFYFRILAHNKSQLRSSTELQKVIKRFADEIPRLTIGIVVGQLTETITLRLPFREVAPQRIAARNNTIRLGAQMATISRSRYNWTI